jgi:hypothetical protein
MGATVGCIVASCPQNFHYPCGMEAGCSLDAHKFILRCPTHAKGGHKGAAAPVQSSASDLGFGPQPMNTDVSTKAGDEEKNVAAPPPPPPPPPPPHPADLPLPPPPRYSPRAPVPNSKYDGSVKHSRTADKDRVSAKSAKTLPHGAPRAGATAADAAAAACALCGDAGGVTRPVEGLRVHDSCALWAPNVYEDSKGTMRNVKSEMRRGSKMVSFADGGLTDGLLANNAHPL